MKIRKGDTVKVLYGKDAGKKAKVLRSFPLIGKVIVDGVNVAKRHMKGDGKDRASAIVSIVKPMNIAKLQLICPNCGKATRVKIERDEAGKSYRVCKACGKRIDQAVSVKSKEAVIEKKAVESSEKKVVTKKIAKK
jgi:large subunit ribosomal protein L24